MTAILQNHYVLAVHNVRASAAFYVDVLGFSVVAEPPGWIFVGRDNCMIMLGECPDDLPPAELGCHSYSPICGSTMPTPGMRNARHVMPIAWARSKTSHGACANSGSGRLMVGQKIFSSD